MMILDMEYQNLKNMDKKSLKSILEDINICSEDLQNNPRAIASLVDNYLNQKKQEKLYRQNNR